MLKLVVVGQNQDRLNTIKKELNGLMDTHAEVRVTTSRPEYCEAQLDTHLKVLIFDTKTINKNIYPFVVQIRKLGFAGPILALGTMPSNFDSRELSQVKNLFQLNKPYTEEQLIGMVKNCLNIELMRQRRDQRFDVNEQAVLEAYSSDFKTETTISNISRSGVRIIGNLDGLNKGDILRLHFNFDKINKERTMSARVVWKKSNQDESEEAGLEFVSQKAVYQYLLDHAVA